MEPSKDAISVRLGRLNRQVLGKASTGIRRTVDRETLFDGLLVLYDECNKESVKKNDEIVRSFLDKYRSALAELRRARVCSADFEMIQIIGKGHFGDVHMVREKNSGDVYALKTLKKEAALTRRGVACYEEERDILAAGAVPWLVKLQYAFQDTANLYLVMEFCPGGDLAEFLVRRNRPLPEKDAAFYVAEVAHALRALHALGYVHRDVKPHNIFLDRCGHVKLGDFGSAARLTEGGSVKVPVGTPDYVAPELLSSVDSPHRHSSACDCWSLGVVAFELVTLKRPFSSAKEDSLVHTLGNIQKYEREVDPKPPFDPLPAAPSEEWRSLVTGLLTVQPSRRYHYLDTLQHPALTHLSPHNIRDQPPPWVPTLRSSTDTSNFAHVPREASPPSSLIFRAKEPFSGQLPFIGFSFVFSDDSEDHSGGFSASHDCTAIDLVAYKSAEKLAAIRGREVAALQAKLAAMEAGEQANADRLQDEAEMQRSKLQREITDLVVQNKRLQRQLEVEHDERRAQERAGLELVAAAKARHTKELSSARSKATELEIERDSLKDSVRSLEKKISELQAECERTAADAETSKALHAHYKDSIAKERALRRQTLSGGEQEAREAGARIATAEATAAKEMRAREEIERKLTLIEEEKKTLEKELEDLRKELARAKDLNVNRERTADSVTEELRTARLQLTQERSRANTLFAQVQELQSTIQEASTREANLEEQRVRTEARLQARLEEAEVRAAHAQKSDARYREKVKTLEQLVRQLEREVSALEARSLPESPAKKQDVVSDTESVGGIETSAQIGAHAQVTLLKEQLERTETQLQARTEEVAALRQEARTANLARWRKEKEVTDLASEAKLSARDIKRLEERLSMALNARKTAEQKATELQNNLDTISPELEATKEELKLLKREYSILKQNHETIQVEVDRSRNDIRKLKSELQYSEKRRIHAEEQAECAMRERAQLRDEAAELRANNTQLEQNNKALQEACSVLEEQLTDLEKLSDLHEMKNNDLETELSRVRAELQTCRTELREAEREASENRTSAALARQQLDEARDRVHHLECELNVIKERLEAKECRIAELEIQCGELESIRGTSERQLESAARRTRDLMEECAVLRTRAQEHHAAVMRLQAQLAEAQEQVSAGKEAAEASAAWWRTREVRADATLRQQSKLINLLQAKLEEANRKKCSLSNKLFGRSARRPTTSPPLWKANKELRQEVERLRGRLASTGDPMSAQTPKRDTAKNLTNGTQSIDVPDSAKDESLQLVWSDNKREKIQAKVEEGALLCSRAKGAKVQAHLVSPMPKACSLTQQEALRAFTIRMEQESHPTEATAVCSSTEQRERILSQLNTTLAYSPRRLLTLKAPPACAQMLAEQAVAIGCSEGLRSLRGVINLEWAPCTGGETGEAGHGAVDALAVAGGRVLIVRDGMLLHASYATVASASKRAESLEPAVDVSRVDLPDTGAVQLLHAINEEIPHGAACAAVATGRRVHLLCWDAAALKFRVLRSFTVDRPPHSLLLTSEALYIAGEKPFRVNLPNGTLETFGLHEPTIQAAAKKHSPPKAILLIRDNPVEILICYTECGVFVDRNGKRTRFEDAKWRNRVNQWAFSNPFLYNVSKDSVNIIHVNEEAYCSPPCTCDTRSLTSNSSEYNAPECYRINVEESALLGTTSEGVFLRSRDGDNYVVLVVEGLLALRSVGASVMSLDSVSLGNLNDSTTSDESREAKTEVVAAVIEHDSSIDNEPRTAFQADIRRRAAQLRERQAREAAARDSEKRRTIGEAIAEILKSDVGPKGAESTSPVSGFSSDTESDGKTYSIKSTNDLCGEMFARQVRFQ